MAMAMEQRDGWLHRRPEQGSSPSVRPRKPMIFPVPLQAESQEYSFPMGCESLNIAHGCLGAGNFRPLHAAGTH